MCQKTYNLTCLDDTTLALQSTLITVHYISSLKNPGMFAFIVCTFIRQSRTQIWIMKQWLWYSTTLVTHVSCEEATLHHTAAVCSGSANHFCCNPYVLSTCILCTCMYEHEQSFTAALFVESWWLFVVLLWLLCMIWPFVRKICTTEMNYTRVDNVGVFSTMLYTDYYLVWPWIQKYQYTLHV